MLLSEIKEKKMSQVCLREKCIFYYLRESFIINRTVKITLVLSLQKLLRILKNEENFGRDNYYRL